MRKETTKAVEKIEEVGEGEGKDGSGPLPKRRWRKGRRDERGWDVEGKKERVEKERKEIGDRGQ